MKRTTLALALLLALPFAYAAEPAKPSDAETAAARAELDRAHEELRAASRRVAELTSKLAGTEHGRNAFAYRFVSDEKRALVGIVLGASRDGVKLAAVTPGGPAEKAGLRAGDRIVAINGQPVVTATPGTDGKAVPFDEDMRVERARSQIGDLEPGEKVRFTVERDGKRMDITAEAERRTSWEYPLVAGAAPGFGPNVSFAFGDLPPGFDENIEVIVERATTEAGKSMEAARAMRIDADRMRRNVFVMRDGSLSELKLAAVNPELGRYFGAQSGVLVLDRGAESFVQLKPGDVIVSVDGSPVEESRGVMRAFARKGPGEVANVEVIRDKRRQVLVVEVPEDAPIFVMPPIPPAPPAPAAAPAAPAAPSVPAVPSARPAPAPRAPAAPAAPTPPEPPKAGRLARIIDGTDLV